jgi:hypothetical protein
MWRLATATLVVSLLLILAACGATTALSPRALRAHGSTLGVCARTPAGWRKKTGFEMPLGPQTLGLTNFRFGLDDPTDTYGLVSYAHRPAGSVTIALDTTYSVDSAHLRFKRSLRVTRRDFSSDPYGEMSWPSAYIAIGKGRAEHTAVVEVGTVTPATIAAANRALAGVHLCSA